MKTSWIICIIALLVPVVASGQGRMVASGAFGEGYAFAIADNGDFYMGGFTSEVLTWSHRGNIFDDSQFVKQADIVGVDSHYYIGTYPWALDALGNLFLMETQHGTWSYQGNLADLSGHDPQGEFIGLIAAEVGVRLVATTDMGDSYMHTPNGSWEYTGNIFADSGAVPAMGESIGGMKSMFR